MTSGVLLVSETLSRHDAEQAKALVGHAGHFMGRALARTRREHRVRHGYVEAFQAGPFGRDEWGYASAGRCERPALRAGKALSGPLLPRVQEALEHCRPYLIQELEQRQPKAIVALGDAAFWSLTHEQALAVEDVRGYVFRGPGGISVIPTYDPNYLMQGNQGLVPAFLWDLDRAREVAEKGFTPERLDTLVDPPVEVWEAWVEETLARLAKNPFLPLALDIETPFKAGKKEGDLRPEDDPSFSVLDISFAIGRGGGVTVPFEMPYIVGIDRLLRAVAELRNEVLIWNAGYDAPRLRHAFPGVLPVQTVRDTMLEWHVLCNSVDRGLGFATSCAPLDNLGLPAWKHLGQDDPYYRVADAVALWRNHEDIALLRRAQMSDRVADLFTRRLPPVLAAMHNGGLLVDEQRRSAAAELLGQRGKAAQQAMTAAVPPELRPFAEWQKRAVAEAGLERLKLAGEAAPDAVLYEHEVSKVQQVCGACGAYPVTKPHVTRKTLKEPTA